MPKVILLLVLLLAQRLVAQTPFTRIYYADTMYTLGLNIGKCPPIQPTGDGGYLLRYLIGQPIIDGEGFDYMIEMKTDASLVPQWQRKVFYSTALPDGSIMATQYEYDDTGVILERRTGAGAIVWQRRIWTPDMGIVQLGEATCANGRVRFNGYVSGAALHNVVVDIDTAGNLLRVDRPTTDLWPAYIERIFADDSGNYYYVLWQTGSTTHDSRKVAKIRPDHTVAWCRRWYVPIYGAHRICGLVRLPGGDVIFAGNYRTSTYDERAYLMRVNMNGDVVWQKSSQTACRPDDIAMMPSGDMVIAAGGQSYTSMSLPVADNVLIADTNGVIRRAFNVDTDRGHWPFYTGLSLPYQRSANEWLYAALAMQPHAPMIVSTDSMGYGQCNTAPTSFDFKDMSFFTFTPDTIAFEPTTLNIEPIVRVTDGTPIAHWDSCDYGMPVTVATWAEKTPMRVAPNPANYVVQIEGDHIAEARLIDVCGRTVASLPQNSHQLNVASLPDGVYMLLAMINGKKYYERVVVAH